MALDRDTDDAIPYRPGPDPHAARCRALASEPHYAPHRDTFLDAAEVIEAGDIAGPIALLHALLAAGVDPRDTGAEMAAVGAP